MQKRYTQGSRSERGRLLDEMGRHTGLHRKSLIRLLSSPLERSARGNEREPIYGPDVDQALAVIAESLDYVCAERLTPTLVWTAQHLEAHGELAVSDEVLQQLGLISVSSVQRHLGRITQDQPQLRRKGRPYGTALTQGIPMKRLPWDEPQPGHLETDLVQHCGPSAAGEYVCTVQMIDVATGWSERDAVLGRSYRVMEDAFRHILLRVPFAVREIHPDNGSEFFNRHLLRFWGQAVPDLQLSRSHPYRKNDNRLVEQKNSSLVRKYLAYERLDTVAQTLALKQLYERMWIYYNLFQPVMHLVEKEITPAVDGQPAQIKRRHDRPRPPFDRLCETAAIAPERREQVEWLRDQTNPRQLRQELYDRIESILSLPGAVPGRPEDVRLTLGVYTIPLESDGSPVTLSFDRTTALR
jgi:hypothetical protein